MSRSQKTVLVWASLVLAFGFVPAACGEKPTEPASAQRSPDPRVEDDSKNVLEAYVKAKQLASMLAAEVARRELNAIVEQFDGETWHNYSATPAFKRLLTVSSEAWPYMRDEWKRARAAGTERGASLRIIVISACWRGICEERALGLLADHAIAEKSLGEVDTVQSISGIYTVTFLAAPMTAQEIAEKFGRFAEWWKAYEPRWQGKMRKKQAAEGSAVLPGDGKEAKKE